MTSIPDHDVLDPRLVFASAESLGFLGPDDEEWHRSRAQGISGTDAAVIVGLSPWDSAFSLWHRKRGLRGLGPVLEPVKVNAAMSWGTRLEPVIADHFAACHPGVEVLVCPQYRSVALPWQVASPDRVLVHEDGSRSVLEIKTAGSDSAWISGVPVYYQCQVQWYMDVLGVDRATVAVLIGGRDYREYEVAYDGVDADMLRSAGEGFHLSVDRGEPPPLDSSSYTYETVKGLPDGVVDEGVQIPLVDAAEYASALAGVDAAGERLNLARSTVLDLIGNYRRAVCGSLSVATRAVRQDGSTHSLKPGPDVARVLEDGVEEKARG